jgi:hypothetical protein
MHEHRLVQPANLIVESFLPPFSSFDGVEQHYAGTPAIHRCFSLARSFNSQSFIVESIPPVGLIADENQEIRSLGISHQQGGLLRVSFWRELVKDKDAISGMTPDALVGYAILKEDVTADVSGQNKHWHVFEAVFRKYEHSNNCVPDVAGFPVRVNDTSFRLQGILYCQQNGLNKACAHVALRSLLSRLVPEGDVSYSAMNAVARASCGSDYDPSNGLNAMQIRAILTHYRVNYRDVDYSQATLADENVRQTQPYQKYLYAGIESGCGALLGFSMAGPEAKDERHIIPFYGHTFNKDTWVPDAQSSYFDIGGGLGYIPSESWTSSFIGHDDNFGANFCVPRLYINPEQAQYVVEILKPGVEYGGMLAEAQASQLLYSICARLIPESPWQQRLVHYARNQKVVLRAICLDRASYVTHLQSIQDWNGIREDPETIKSLESLSPDVLWMIEISIPHLFPANERKLGEIILDARMPLQPDGDVHYGAFVIARLSGQFVVLNEMNNGGPSFETVPSRIQSHVAVWRHA